MRPPWANHSSIAGAVSPAASRGPARPTGRHSCSTPCRRQSREFVWPLPPASHAPSSATLSPESCAATCAPCFHHPNRGRALQRKGRIAAARLLPAPAPARCHVPAPPAATCAAPGSAGNRRWRLVSVNAVCLSCPSLFLYAIYLLIRQRRPGPPPRPALMYTMKRCFYFAAASPTTALMRRTPAEELSSF